jgi:hypothetical protein
MEVAGANRRRSLLLFFESRRSAVAQLWSLAIIERMSQRDLQQNRATLTGFKGRRCFASLATGSIRFRFDDREMQGHYIWVDPPWVFSSASAEITTSGAYTEEEAKEWFQLLGPLRETTFQDFEPRQNGEVTFIFSDGYRLFIPLDPESDTTDSDYDHWYAYNG